MFWDRMIILVDMNAFFAAIEQLDNPALRGQPVVITNGSQGTCIITSSYEARSYGIKTGMRLREARQLCPHLIQAPSHPKRYTEISRAIMTALEDVTPDVEVFSVDEAFLDVTHCQRLWGSAETIGKLVKQKVFEASGLLCSIGISGDKTTAKYAAKRNKPNGFTIIPPWEAKQQLASVPVTDLCGINKGIARFLAQYGAYTCGDVARLPIGILAKRYGHPGRRIWYMCQGADPDPVRTRVAPPKSMGHGKVMPPNTRDKQVILTYLLHMSEKLAARLRRHDLQAQHFSIGLRLQQGGWLGAKVQTVQPTHHGRDIYNLALAVFVSSWCGEGVCQVQITGLDPKPTAQQGDLFLDYDEEQAVLNNVRDAINLRYGEFALAPARLLGRSAMPNVIAPAWKPDGHRETIN